MSEIRDYPHRLIEVDLPIRRVSEQARREKSIRRGHISTLHLWWARRPLAACRAVLCAGLWPDPADELCPQSFRDEAAAAVAGFAKRVVNDRELAEVCGDTFPEWQRLSSGMLSRGNRESNEQLRDALLLFIGDFSSWNATTSDPFVDTAQKITLAAKAALHPDLPGLNILDPFAGGGSIPLEVLRVGANAHASDLNPVAVLLNHVTLEAIPRYRERLGTAVREWGLWMRAQVENELKGCYPVGDNGANSIAYFWARTIRCEGPSCGVELPLLQSTGLARRPKRYVGLRLVPNSKKKRIDIEIVETTGNGRNTDTLGTYRGGKATCPSCGFTTANPRVRAQLKERRGGSTDARLVCIAEDRPGASGRVYRVPTDEDIAAAALASDLLAKRPPREDGLSLVPDELIPQLRVWKNNPIRVHLYGMKTWGDLFTTRQSLAITAFIDALQRAEVMIRRAEDAEFSKAVVSCLAMVVGRQIDRMSTLCFWHSIGEKLEHTFSRQALSLIACFPEANPFSSSTGSFGHSVEWVAGVADAGIGFPGTAAVEMRSATELALPDDSMAAVFTDPPYYDAVPYGEISDFFYVWLRRAVGNLYPKLFSEVLVEKRDECVFNPEAVSREGLKKDAVFFRRMMTRALVEARRVIVRNGVCIVVFAHKTTEGWEAQLQAMLDAGWVITASWPIDTEMNTRLRAQGSAALASSIHLVCRPRETVSGSTEAIGDWRMILVDLPRRVHEWMPRLAREGVVGADAIFACLGPALELYSRYSHVEKASGDKVLLSEYLEHVWSAVSQEALSMIFEDADAVGLEQDARLTAMWLWTLAAPTGDSVADEDPADTTDVETETGEAGDVKAVGGFFLPFDAARKIAQGLGAQLDALENVVELKGDKARLLSVIERTKHLFGSTHRSSAGKKTTKKKQESLFSVVEEAVDEAGWNEAGAPNTGTTTLDRVHQAMLLFAAGRSEALKRFLVEDRIGAQAPFWKLAQALSALYPAKANEKRWVDGVLARKKGLGF